MDVVLTTKILNSLKVQERFDKDSVINQNNYTQELETVVIDTEDFI
jgi:hypothetical protein